jgi:hypothetical protein
MMVGLRGTAGGSDENKIGLDHALFRRRRKLRKIIQRHILMTPFLRISGLFEGGVMRPNLEAVPVA